MMKLGALMTMAKSLLFKKETIFILLKFMINLQWNGSKVNQHN